MYDLIKRLISVGAGDTCRMVTSWQPIMIIDWIWTDKSTIILKPFRQIVIKLKGFIVI
jgi:hypothetical protein